MKGNTINEIGNTYGSLTVIRDAGLSKWRQNRWLCLCNCGNTHTALGTSLRLGKVSSCGCQLKRRKDDEQVIRKMIESYKLSSKKRGQPFNLTFEEFKDIAEKNCHYCNGEPRERIKTRVMKRKDGTTRKITFQPAHLNGIDRLDSSIGYEINNCVPCCTTCNWMKSNLSVDEFITHLNKLVKHLKLTGK